ncbi:MULTISPECIES: hypothetical protein [Enterobacterales]|uniref:hypothetical protein n=1 Tax=Enterobacterales TaxID=91347 RepID=UPI000B02D2C8|nr:MULTISPECIES: hypothetical protein [Enterobacterales]MBB3305703.1 hypothetical protein [Enterobacter sp. Sphag1F]NYI14948.1 hypothetical protein [Enterobacter sp. Sphag71]
MTKAISGPDFKIMILFIIFDCELYRDEMNFRFAAVQFPDCWPPFPSSLIYYSRS